MNKFLRVLIGMLCVLTISSKAFAVESYLEHKKRMEESSSGRVSTVGPYRANPGDPTEEASHYHGNAEFRPGATVLQNNKHIFAFVPTDITGVKTARENGEDKYRHTTERGYYRCDENGVVVAVSTTATCFTYRSASNRTSWTIRVVRKLGTPLRVEKIFKESNGQLVLWATFDPKDDSNTYASVDAKKYAAAHGAAQQAATNPTDTSAPPPPAESQVENTVKKGVGDLLKGFGR